MSNELQVGPFEINLSTRDGKEYKYRVGLSELSSIFHKIPGATDILDEVYNTQKNRYELYAAMDKRSSALHTAVNKIAMLTRRCYHGFYIHPGDQEEQEEIEFLKQVRNDIKHLKIPDMFFAIARRLCLDGDAVLHKKMISGKPRWDFLPLCKLTALRQQGDIGKAQLLETLYSGPASVYVYDEVGPEQHVYRRSNIIHIPLNNMAEVVKDIKGRDTWGIWSQSPLESLRPDVYWQLSAMVNDMIWRRLYTPREHHEVDVTDLMDLSMYEGDTEDERREKAITAVGTAITAYINGLKNQLPDQGYVTPKVGDVSSVKITVIEPKSTNYVSPNDLLTQLSSSISSAYYVRLTDKSSASYAAEHIISSDTQVCAEFLAGIIKEYILEEVKALYVDNEHVEKLDVRLQLILPKDQESLVREAAVLRAAGVAPIDEIRTRTLGWDPLTEEQRRRLQEEQAMNQGGLDNQPPGEGNVGRNAQTRDQIISRFITRSPSDENPPETDDSKKANQKT